MILDETPPEVLDKFAACISLERLAEASEVAEFVAFLASDRNTYATGATFDVNGGERLTGTGVRCMGGTRQ